MNDDRYTYKDSESLEKIYREMTIASSEQFMHSPANVWKEQAPKVEKVVKRDVHVHPTTLEVETTEELEELKLKVEEVAGSIAERCRFLEKRIKDLRDALSKRKEIHEKIVNDINAEIKEKEGLMAKMSKPEDIRDVMADISALKSQLRREEVSYWRDVTTITNELNVLEEQYYILSKIRGIVGGE